jgi:uncharacterized repeat protein (TIGR01451 family)
MEGRSETVAASFDRLGAGADRPQAGTLTGVFAPGAPPLMETLRTLVVTPRRYVTPGETLRVEFTFSNLGGSAATNVRVRFMLPSGVTAIEGGDTIDDAALNAPLTAVEGAAIGDLAPNEQRRVACSFRVQDRIEDGSELLFQAALVADQTLVVASNAVRVVVRSEPMLQSASTFVTIAAPDAPKPGDVLVVRATIANTGSSSAHNVRAFLPVPLNTTYVARSARIGGRTLLNSGEEPFDYASDVVVAETLAPGQSVVVEYQAAIASPLADGMRIKVIGSIASREVQEFTVQSADVVVTSPPDFSGEETVLTVFCDDVVSPGTRIPMMMRIVNTGTGDAQNVSVSFELPPGLTYTPGSAHLDGQPVSDEVFAGSAFSFGAVPPGRTIDVGISATVGVQSVEDLPIAVTLRWRGASSGPVSERRFTRTLRVRLSSRFTRARNYIEADRAMVQAREDVTFTAHVFNDGTAAEPNVALRVIPGAFLEDVRIAESPDEPVPYAEPFDLGIVQPHAARTFTIRARVGSPVPDRTQIALTAVLEFASATFDLGVSNVVVRSRPHVSPDSCTWERVQAEPLRPGRTHDVEIRFLNDGPDVLRDARLVLDLPPELLLERAQNARRETPNTLYFGEIPAESTHEARVSIRLLRAPKDDRTLLLEGTLTGRGISAVPFEALEILTYAEPDFESGAELRSNPAENVQAGERIAYELRLHNSGDGTAQRLIVRAVPSNLAVYVPGSTTLSGIAISDDLGTSQLWSQRGLILTDVSPGIDLRIRWEMLAISPLAAGTAIDTHAVVEWDGSRSLALAAPALRALSSPSLEAGAGGTPISVAHLAPALTVPPPETIVPPPPPIPTVESVVEEPGVPAEAPLFAAPEAESIRDSESPLLYRDLSEQQLAQIVQTLERSDAGGLIRHVFAVRALLPSAIAGSDARNAHELEGLLRALQAPLDRLFVKLRMPRLAITAKDLEDRESRSAMCSLVAAVLDAGTAQPPARAAGAVRLSGNVDIDVLRGRANELEHVPLGSIAPWILSAHLMLAHVEYDDGASSDVLALYRNEALKVFGVLETLPMPEFHRVLSSSVNRTLDDALGAVLDALRAAVRVGVD